MRSTLKVPRVARSLSWVLRCLCCALLSTVAVVAAAERGVAEVTPVSGVSTLHHLGRTIETSSMGWGGQWGRQPDLKRSVPPASPASDSREEMAVTGADLYRVSCRACHRPDGSGAPPEINTIIDPVRAASDEWMMARMKEKGRPADRAYIHGLTAETEADLQKRFKVGGHSMPSFDHLSKDEIDTLRPYLDQLAGLPGAEARQRYVTESTARVGELVVKGTCHICHDAVGRDDVQTTVLSGIIPPLSSLPRQKSFGDFLKKVREGAPVRLGSAAVMAHGRMPVFPHLSEPEVAAAYAYLLRYPPR